MASLPALIRHSDGTVENVVIEFERLAMWNGLETFFSLNRSFSDFYKRIAKPPTFLEQSPSLTPFGDSQRIWNDQSKQFADAISEQKETRPQRRQRRESKSESDMDENESELNISNSLFNSSSSGNLCSDLFQKKKNIQFYHFLFLFLDDGDNLYPDEVLRRMVSLDPLTDFADSEHQ